MSFYTDLENARLRDKNAAMLRELDTLRAELGVVRADLDFAKALADAANAVAGEANRISRRAFDERDAALARAADSDARLVRAIDAAKTAALAVLEGEELDALETILDFDADSPVSSTCPRDPCCQCEPCEYFDDGLDSGDGLDAARKGRTTPSVRR